MVWYGKSKKYRIYQWYGMVNRKNIAFLPLVRPFYQWYTGGNYSLGPHCIISCNNSSPVCYSDNINGRFIYWSWMYHQRLLPNPFIWFGTRYSSSSVMRCMESTNLLSIKFLIEWARYRWNWVPMYICCMYVLVL
jgi:hypothetical protein